MGEPLPRGLDPQRLSLREFVGIVNAVEQESVDRYGQFAALMKQRGEVETAQVFSNMQEEERRHTEAVMSWAEALGEAIPPVMEFEWRLPPELFSSWDEVAGSALVTPYRALAIAVQNEERAFSMYSFIAAHAQDERIVGEAEKLAGEELQHAALLRRWRRNAYHQQQKGERPPSVAVETLSDLEVLLSDREAKIAACHRDLGQRLRSIGDAEAAELLAKLAANPSRPVEAAAVCNDEACDAQDAVQLLFAAQKPLEALSEDLEAVLPRAGDPEVFAEAERALSNVVGRLAQLTFLIELRGRAKRS